MRKAVFQDKTATNVTTRKSLSEAQERPQLVMTPLHPRWVEFLAWLSEPEYLDFEARNGCITHSHCQSNLRFSRTILTQMGGIDVRASLAFFREHGGYCDCEVLMNVEASFAAQEINPGSLRTRAA